MDLFESTEEKLAFILGEAMRFIIKEVDEGHPFVLVLSDDEALAELMEWWNLEYVNNWNDSAAAIEDKVRFVLYTPEIAHPDALRGFFGDILLIIDTDDEEIVEAARYCVTSPRSRVIDLRFAESLDEIIKEAANIYDRWQDDD